MLFSYGLCVAVVLVYIVCQQCLASISIDKKANVCTPACVHGQCKNATCVCEMGWAGKACTSCHSRIRLTSKSGYISDGVGNYSENMRCSWLLDASDMPGMKVSMKLDQFATECGWDHVFLYNGDGVFSEQLAALSGVLSPSSKLSEREFVADSGQGFVYFYSDLAYNMTGFNISYRVSKCPFDCNNNGDCDLNTGQCRCNTMWKGEACNIKSCKNYCVNGKCDEDDICQCFAGYTGPHCNIPIQKAVWESVSVSQSLGGRASHAATILNDSLWVYGGLGFNSATIKQFARFDFGASKWTVLTSENADTHMSLRYDHSMITYKNSLYVFGGVINDQREITNEFWRYDTVGEIWKRINSHNTDSDAMPYAVAGHTAHVIGNVMVVIFGVNPYRGYLNVVQEFHFLNSSWRIPELSGDRVYGTYGHSSVLDHTNDYIYVYGGYYSQPASAMGSVSDRLYRYMPLSRKWESLRCSGRQTFLHAAAISDGVFIVTGGNAHNESLPNKATECYAEAVMAYDIECNEWYTMDPADYLVVGTNRYGHTMTAHKSNLYVYGGFNGRMLEDMIKFTPGECSQKSNENQCLLSRQGVKCRWTKKNCSRRDEAKALVSSNYKDDHYDDEVVCSASVGVDCQLDCRQYLDCTSCTVAPISCIWCAQTCQHTCPDKTDQMVVKQSECAPKQVMCRLAQTCTACNEIDGCVWQNKINVGAFCANKESLHEATPIDEGKKVTVGADEQESILSLNLAEEALDQACPAPCAFYSNCTECGAHGCMWCSTLSRCIDINAYLPSFPYGQCTQWKSPQSPCYHPDTCESQLTCLDCQELSPRCGWCDDGSATGLGKCVQGGYSGPVTNDGRGKYVPDPHGCNQDMWYFFECPACQCNGHGYCSNATEATPAAARGNTELACERCDDNTIGQHCQTCQKGFYGIALNGGNCTECSCNGQATDCDPETGDCYCTTKGVSGKYCDKCDQKYRGDPKNRTCFYELSVDFIFTFSLKSDASEPKDKFVTQINFVTKPPKEDTDVTFKLTCSGSPTAKVNLTVQSALFDTPKHERRFLANTPCSEIERTFTSNDFKFGPSANTTFLVFVYDFKVPVIIQISFAQTPPIDWIRFFATFACCFIFLLFMAGILWKVKIRVDMYRRRQRMFVEMEQMASRPFGCAQLELPESKTYKTKPTPLCIEPLRDYKAAVVTVAIKLPTGGMPHAPSGQTGLAVGSALCWLTPAQISLLQTPSTADEEEQANKARNSSRIGPRLANIIMPFS